MNDLAGFDVGRVWCPDLRDPLRSQFLRLIAARRESVSAKARPVGTSDPDAPAAERRDLQRRLLRAIDSTLREPRRPRALETLDQVLRQGRR